MYFIPGFANAKYNARKRFRLLFLDNVLNNPDLKTKDNLEVLATDDD